MKHVGVSAFGRMAELRPAPIRDERALALWFGLFAAPAGWSVALMVTYAMAAHSCYPKARPLSAPSFDGTRAVVGTVIVLAIVVAVAAVVTALRTWRAIQPGHAGRESVLLGADGGRRRFMAFAGILMSVLFLFLMVLNGVSLVLVPPCTYGG